MHDGGKSGGPPWRDWIGVLGLPFLGVVVAIIAFTSYYTVQAGSVGVVTRFGAFHGQTPPGLHFKMPLGIDRVVEVPVDRRQKMEFGFTTRQADVRTDKETTLVLPLSSPMLEYLERAQPRP